jgi:metallo-beta-lactamase family protein
MVDAGHILGSAMVILDIEDQEEKRDLRLVFSGDIGRDRRPILRDPSFIDRADVLIMESTYGDRAHPPDYDVDEALARIVNDAYRQQGKVIVPAFAVGRTQEIVYRLHRLREINRIPRDLMVYVDSPLAIDATGIYRLHPETYDQEMMHMLFDNHQDPFGFNMMRYTRATSESKELNTLQGPAVIISASGMAEAGRILHHLKNNVEDPRNTVLITGWQAPHTLGRRIVEKREKIRIFGEEYHLRARVETLNGLSGHADKDELVEWARHIQPRPGHTFLVHGEDEPAEALAANLRKEGFPRVAIPYPTNTFTV